MLVNHYFRNPGGGNYSIEKVFSIISQALTSQILVRRFFTQRPVDLPAIYRVSRLQGDIHHITGAVNYLALGLPRNSTIITIHDIGHLTETLSGWRKAFYKNIFWKLPLHRVSYVTAISNFTRNAIVENLQIESTKIQVIYNPVDPLFRFTYPLRNSCPVIMQIGVGKNKNIDTLIKAVDGLDVKLLLVRRPEDELVRKLNGHRINFEFRYNLSDQELAQAYCDSNILYFGSTYEGFGLPVIEAQAVGRPVIISNIESLIEISNDSSIITELNNVEHVRNAIVNLLFNSDLYNRYMELGRQNARRFSPEVIANQYYALYQNVMDNN